MVAHRGTIPQSTDYHLSVQSENQTDDEKKLMKVEQKNKSDINIWRQYLFEKRIIFI